MQANTHAADEAADLEVAGITTGVAVPVGVALAPQAQPAQRVRAAPSRVAWKVVSKVLLNYCVTMCAILAAFRGLLWLICHPAEKKPAYASPSRMALSTCRHPSDTAGVLAHDLMGLKLKPPHKLTLLASYGCPLSLKQIGLVAGKLDFDTVWCEPADASTASRSWSDPRCRLLHSVNYSVPAWWGTDNRITPGLRPLPILIMRYYCYLVTPDAHCECTMPKHLSAILMG